MEERSDPKYAPGQEVTVQPDDPEKKADLMPAGDTGGPDQERAGGKKNWTGTEGDLTLVAVFEDMTGAKSCADDLARRNWKVDVTLLSRKPDGPEEGPRPGNVITGPGYGLSAEDQSPPRDAPMGSGVAVGATLGATAGLLAATLAVPGMGGLVGAAPLVTTLAGAGIGSFLGGLTEYSTAEHQDDASLYAGQVRKGGVLLLARTSKEDADQVRRLLEIWRPLEIRVQ